MLGTCSPSPDSSTAQTTKKLIEQVEIYLSQAYIRIPRSKNRASCFALPFTFTHTQGKKP